MACQSAWNCQCFSEWQWFQEMCGAHPIKLSVHMLCMVDCSACYPDMMVLHGVQLNHRGAMIAATGQP